MAEIDQKRDGSLVIVGQGALVEAGGGWVVPELIEASGARVRNRILDYLGAKIENDNTRLAYMRVIAKFCSFIEDQGGERLQSVAALDIAAYLRSLKNDGAAIATQKQHMAALRMLFDELVTGGAMPFNPALSVKAPRHSVLKGKTPILTAEEAGELLRSIDTSTIIGLRDRAFIGCMAFTFARVSAVCGLDVEDLFHQNRRLWLRLLEKNSKHHVMPCHHTLEHYLVEYIDAAKLIDGAVPLFQSIDKYTRNLSGLRFNRIKAWDMVRRRAKDAGIDTKVCNHTFRGTGITAYLENGGVLEKAQQMAAHASTRTTQLYDRRGDQVTLDEVVKINIRG